MSSSKSLLNPLVIVCILFVCGCSPTAEQENANKNNLESANATVVVAAASDLKFAFDELITAFKQEHPTIEVKVTYGSSGIFFSQLSNKAPFDIYFSADIAYPRKLVEQGLAFEESEWLYAVGQIVVWVPNDSPIDVERLGMKALLDPAARKIAIANPEHAPYGQAAQAAMISQGVFDQVQERLVLGENIAQTAQFVESGSADIGIIALSLALAPAMKDKGHFWTVPLDAYPTMEQGCVILKWATDLQAVGKLRTFVASSTGAEILKRYGFRLPE